MEQVPKLRVLEVPTTWGVEVWTRTAFSRAGIGGYQQGVSQECLEDWELLDM